MMNLIDIQVDVVFLHTNRGCFQIQVQKNKDMKSIWNIIQTMRNIFSHITWEWLETYQCLPQTSLVTPYIYNTT